MILKIAELGMALEFVEGELISYELDTNGEVDFTSVGVIESITYEDLTSFLRKEENSLGVDRFSKEQFVEKMSLLVDMLTKTNEDETLGILEEVMEQVLQKSGFCKSIHDIYIDLLFSENFTMSMDEVYDYLKKEQELINDALKLLED